MEFKTPIKLFYDNSPRGTILVRWKIESIININGFQEMKPIILEIIDIPMKEYKIKIEIRDFKFTKSIAFYLDSPCYYNSKKNEIHLIFKTEPF